jgi:hypothetical protein
MEGDLSQILYDEYFSTSNRHVEIKLKSGRVISGVIVSFFHGSEDWGEPFITRWRIAEFNRDTLLITDTCGNCIGEIINQQDILRVEFLDNHLTMEFE